MLTPGNLLARRGILALVSHKLDSLMGGRFHIISMVCAVVYGNSIGVVGYSRNHRPVIAHFYANNTLAHIAIAVANAHQDFMGNLIGAAGGVCYIMMICRGEGIGVRKHTCRRIIVYGQFAVGNVNFIGNQHSASPYGDTVDDDGTHAVWGGDGHAASSCCALASLGAAGQAGFFHMHHVIRQCGRIVRAILYRYVGGVGRCLRRSKWRQGYAVIYCCSCTRHGGDSCCGKLRTLGSSATVKLKIKAAKMVQTVRKASIGVILISTASRGASGRTSRRSKVGPKGIEEVRASNQLTVNLKRGNGFFVVLSIKILQLNGRTVIKAEEQAV